MDKVYTIHIEGISGEHIMIEDIFDTPELAEERVPEIMKNIIEDYPRWSEKNEFEWRIINEEEYPNQNKRWILFVKYHKEENFNRDCEIFILERNLVTYPKNIKGVIRKMILFARL